MQVCETNLQNESYFQGGFMSTTPTPIVFTPQQKATALFVLMACATQDGLVDDLFPSAGDPDYHTHFGQDLNVDKDFLGVFVKKCNDLQVAPAFAAQCRALLTSFSSIADNYGGSYCPSGDVLRELSAVVK